MSTASVRVLIADDHALVREGLASLLTPLSGFSLVGAACNGEEAVDLFRLHRPDVLLMDVRLPVVDGLGAAKILRKEFPNAVIVLLSAFASGEVVYQATRIGVKSFLSKEMPSAEFLNTLRRVASGETYFPPAITALLTERLCQPTLTTREREVLTCLATGKSNDEVAASLFIAEGTVKAHLVSIYEKIGVQDRTQAVTEGIRRGLIQLT